MAQPRFKFTVLGNYIHGKFAPPQDPNGDRISRSPANFDDELGRFTYSYRSVDEAVGSARQAFKKWRLQSQLDRAQLLKKYQEALKRREDELIEAIAREVGKPLWESKTEYSAMVNKVDVTIQESARLIESFTLDKVMEGTQGSCRYYPLGVMAVI